MESLELSGCDSQRNRSLQEDIQRMLRNDSFNDMVFLCGDAQEAVPASRMVVAARSPVMEMMLLKDAESKQSRIPLPDMDAATLRICLEFFYTDKVQDSSWLGYETSMKVISAAKFFLVSKLEQLAISHLKSICYVHRDLTDLVKAYSYGVNLNHTHPCVHLHSLLQKLGECVHFYVNAWGSELHRHLSEQALLHLVQPLCDGSMEVYDGFYTILQWCASQLVLISDNPRQEERLIQNFMHKFVPQPETDLWQHISQRTSIGSTNMCVDTSTSRILKLFSLHLANILKKFPLDFAKMPSSILCGIIDPLDILQSSILERAYRFQALSRPDFMRWDEFGCGKSYGINEHDFTVISCDSDEFEGFARCNFGVHMASFLCCQWEMIVLSPCMLRIGFYRSQPHQTPTICDKLVLGDHERSCGLSSDGRLHYNFGGEEGHSFYCKAECFDKPGVVRVGVHLGVENFSFSVNGRKIGEPCSVSWELGEVIYPAISMQKPGKARVRMVVEEEMANPHKILRNCGEGKRIRKQE